MERVCTHYGIDSISDALVRRVDGMYLVDVGDGRRALPDDAHVACLCRRMYASVMGV